MLSIIVGGSIFIIGIMIVVMIAKSIKKKESKLQYNANGCQLGTDGNPISKPVYSRRLFGGRRVIHYNSCIRKTSMVTVYVVGIFLTLLVALGIAALIHAAKSPQTSGSSGSAGWDLFGSFILLFSTI